MQLELAILSRRGGRNYNEDACGHWHSDTHLCCVVADGAGGHGGGDKASKLAVQQVIERYAAAPSEAPEALRQLIVDTNRSLIAHRGEAENTQNMHSTIVALFVDLEKYSATWGHCGDSRLYGFRGGRLAFQTRDHSLVQSLVDGGLLTEDRMRTHPQRSELLSALGVGEQDLQVSVSERPWAMQPGDAFLLCTDGVWEYVVENELEQALAAAASPQAWLDDVEKRVLAAAVHKPRHDNFSGLAVWVTDAAG
jgi:serine/threonine protein phosphatase PrpC